MKNIYLKLSLFYILLLIENLVYTQPIIEIPHQLLDKHEFVTIFGKGSGSGGIVFDSNYVGLPLYFEFQENEWNKYIFDSNTTIIITQHHGDIGTYFFIIENNKPIKIFGSFISDSLKVFQLLNKDILFYLTINHGEDEAINQYILLNLSDNNDTTATYINERYKLFMAGDIYKYSTVSKLKFKNNNLYLNSKIKILNINTGQIEKK